MAGTFSKCRLFCPDYARRHKSKIEYQRNFRKVSDLDFELLKQLLPTEQAASVNGDDSICKNCFAMFKRDLQDFVKEQRRLSLSDAAVEEEQAMIEDVKEVISAANVRYNNSGKLYVSSSKDGDMKLWDGVSNKCICTFPQAHDGNEVCSVYFSHNGKYVLSSGKDSIVKLWELSMSRCLIAYTGAGATGKQVHRAQGIFNHSEDYVLFPDEKTTSLCSWDSRNAERQRLLSLGHNNTVRHLVHSPTGPAFLTCSDDFRARFWYRRVEAVD
ncbi:hypothetical protein ISCGN_027222 [Ixodes scapularis]